ncbi:MAG TPA: peptidase S8, partial [Lachnospiraceae bacterium]|nr:peptidase S8 [Lachnospiraceae bacterium]
MTGKGVGVAIVDTGISLHKDFAGEENRVIAFKDFINKLPDPYDDNGHGTHVSGIVGGNGYSSKGRYVGVAPGCNLIGVKVLDYRGDGNISDVLAGLQWIIDNRFKYNIRVVNISVGTTSKENMDENSLLVQGVNAIWDSGVVVVVAAGNNGPG